MCCSRGWGILGSCIDVVVVGISHGVRQREHIQERHAARIDSIGRNLVVGKRPPGLRVVDDDQRAGWRSGLREISGPFERRRHGVSANGLDIVQPCVVDRVEEEQLLAVGVHLRNPWHWTAEGAAEGVIAIERLGNIQCVVEVVVGVPHLVPLVPVASAVILGTHRAW